MTPAEVVACVERMQRNVENVLLFLPTWRNEPTDDDEVAMYAAIAFHEAGRLLDFCAPKTCGTCADARETNDGVSKRKCVSDASECYGWMWGVDHGCPAWRQKDGAQ